MRIDFDRLLANGFEEAHPDTRWAMVHRHTLPDDTEVTPWVNELFRQTRFLWTPPVPLRLHPPSESPLYERRSTSLVETERGPIEIAFGLGVWYAERPYGERPENGWTLNPEYLKNCRSKDALQVQARILLNTTAEGAHVPMTGYNIRYDAVDGRRIFQYYPDFSLLARRAHEHLLLHLGGWRSKDLEKYDVTPTRATQAGKCRRRSCRRFIQEGDPLVRMPDLTQTHLDPKPVTMCADCGLRLFPAWEALVRGIVDARVEHLRTHLTTR